MEKKSFRLSTNLDGTDKYLTVNFDQTYDCLEILSLKISQDKIYKDFSANYGVLVGRVIANGGFGIPNAKVSVFIPISDDDSTNDDIVAKYPYSKITDTTGDGIRYNLLSPKNFPAGTFPLKDEILNDDITLEVYEKYYKFTTKTNDSGDYMIFGVPIGQQVIHMDTDLSDIGELSFTADSMVANGINKSLFAQAGTDYVFKGGKNLEQLPQLISKTLSVDVKPLWGDVSTQQVGITRADFKINLLVNPVAYLTFSVAYDEQHLKYGIYDSSDGHVNESDGHRPGFVGRLLPNTSQSVKAYKYDENNVELAFDDTNYKMISSDDDINKGIYMFILPCDLGKVITNEHGELVPSGNNNGIGTTGKWRMEVFSNNGAGISNFLIQKNPDRSPFIIRSGRVYSVKLQFFDAYTLRDSGKHNIPKTNDENQIFNPGDWMNGCLYFGYGHFDKTGRDYPGWLHYQNAWYNVTTYIIDVTDYLDVLADKTKGADYYPGITDFKFYNDSDFPPGIVAQLGLDNLMFGDKNSSYQPFVASGFQNRYVFLKGAKPDWDCFLSMKTYINK